VCRYLAEHPDVSSVLESEIRARALAGAAVGSPDEVTEDA
jgi:hypothetical protein